MLALLLGLSFSTADGAVELQFFRGSFDAEADSILLEWTTSYESRTAYYYIKRKEADSLVEPEVINVVLEGEVVDKIDAAIDGTTGAAYQVFDLEIQSDIVYEYSLWEMETNNVEPASAERSIVIQASENQTSTELGQATATATATQTPTSDPNSTSTPTIEPTATLPVTSTPVAGSESDATAAPDATSESSAESAATAESEGATPDSTQQAAQETTTPNEGISETATATVFIVENTPVPTATPIPPTATPTAQSGVAEAAELPQDETYPEPENGEGEEEGEYVPPPTNTPETISQQERQQIGENSEAPSTGQQGQALTEVDESEINQNRLILWGGFIGSLVFFIAVIVGTILMYRQRNNGG